MRWRFVPVALLAALITQAAWAQEGGFEVADADGDKKVSEQELKDYVSRRMPEFKQFGELIRRLDADENKSLSAEEFEERFDAIQAIGMGPAPDSDTQESDKADKEKVVEFVDRYEERFAKRDPKLGTTIDAVPAFDEKGSKFDWASTRGKHTVIVFGCLT